MRTVHDDGLLTAAVQHVRDLIWVVDADGVVLYVNDATAHVLDSHADARGSQAASYVHPDDQPLAAEHRAHLLEAPGRSTTTVLRVRHGDGGWRHLETYGVNLLDDPDVRGLLYVSRDVEDRAQAEAMLLRALGAQCVVSELGVRALIVEDVDTVVDEALARVSAVLGSPWVTLGRAGPDGVLRPQAEHGTPTAPDGLPTLEAGLQAPAGPIGLLTAHGLPASPGPADTHFLKGVANVLAGALQRAER